MTTITFKKFPEEPPDTNNYSPSYGGSWSSEWCVVIDADGNARNARYTIGPSAKEALAKGIKNVPSNWQEPGWGPRYVLWAYASEVVAASKGATLMQPSPSQPSQPSGPAWQDAPTVPGDWVLSTTMTLELQENITQHEIDTGGVWPGGRWFGPIPTEEDAK